MSTQIANFASCLGKYDGSVLAGTIATLDPSSVAIGNSDLSLNSGYLSNPNAFTTPNVGNGTGFSVTGWFNPSGAQTSFFTPIFDMSGASAVATNHITLCVSGNSVTPVLVATFNAQTSVYVPSGSVNANAWNFFGYTVCCSGGTQLIQNLTVNGTTTSVTGGTYSPLTVANTYVGYGATPYNNYFNGKIDDFRYYGRVLCPMEMRVLYGYAYGKSVGPSNVSAVAPLLGGSVTVIQTSTTTAMISVPNSGTFSYLQLKRVGSNSTTYTTNISPSALTASGASYVYSDTGLTNLVTYIYTLTPYVLGTPGMSSTPFSVTMVSAPTAMTGLAAISFTATSGNWTGFTLAWSGGTGTGVSYTYYVNNVQVYPSGTAGNVVFTGLPTPSSSTTPTAYAWYVDVCANNLAGTTHGISTIYAPPTAISSVTLSNAGIGVFDVTWVSGLGNSVTYLYDVSSSGAIITPTGNYTTSVLTASSTRITLTNTAQKTYTVVVNATNVGGTVSSVASGLITTLSPNKVTVNTVIFRYSASGYSGNRIGAFSNNLQTGDCIVSGLSSGNTYKIYAFGNSTSITYTMAYSVTGTGNTIYVLAVGGGGNGGDDQGGGGGAGGVVQKSVILTTTSDTITITVGDGGLNTTVSFTTQTGSNITAYAGGNGGQVGLGGGSGGSGGGGGSNTSTAGSQSAAAIAANNAGYSGGIGYPGGYLNGGGGGGAGGPGYAYNSNAGNGSTYGSGGNGIKCTLNGIKDFGSYGTYYWGGGGGGCVYSSNVNYPTSGSGGLGGGGGGSGNNGASAGIGGGSAINPGGTPTTVSGAGGANTGGGGGGTWGATGSKGGSGIVVIAFPV